jgi:Right handed beta helix region
MRYGFTFMTLASILRSAETADNTLFLMTLRETCAQLPRHQAGQMSPRLASGCSPTDRQRETLSKTCPNLPILILAAFLATAGATAAATTYYVDQVTGNDANSGTSAGMPWKNAPGMSAFTGSGTLAGGDTVYFNSAATWLVTGTQGIYLTGGVTYIGNGWGSGTRAKLKANADLASAVVRFRDHPTYPTVFKGFEVDANSKITNGIEMNHSFYAGPLTGATKRVDDAIVHHIWSSTSLGQYKYGIIVSNHGGTAGEVDNVEILNSVVHDTSRDALPIYPGDENANCIVRNVVVRGNTVYNTGQDPAYGAGSGIIVKGRVIDATIENNYVYNTVAAGIFVNGNETNHFGFGPTNIHIRYNIVNVNTVHGSIRLYDGASGKDPKDVKIYGNIVYNNSLNAGLLLDSDLGNSNSLRVYNNTFYNASVMINNSAATFPIFEFKNNIIFNTSATPLSDSGRITAHSNNIYFGTGTLVKSKGVNFSAANLADYEATASAGNPQFANTGSLPSGFVGTYGVNLAPNATGLSLQNRSYGIGHGIALASPYDGSVNDVARPNGGPWDIGSYQSTQLSGLSAPQNLRVSP